MSLAATLALAVEFSSTFAMHEGYGVAHFVNQGGGHLVYDPADGNLKRDPMSGHLLYDPGEIRSQKLTNTGDVAFQVSTGLFHVDFGPGGTYDFDFDAGDFKPTLNPGDSIWLSYKITIHDYNDGWPLTSCDAMATGDIICSDVSDFSSFISLPASVLVHLALIES